MGYRRDTAPNTTDATTRGAICGKWGRDAGPIEREWRASPALLKRTVRALGNRTLDRRTSIGRALSAWRADLVRDLGGDVSTQRAAIVDLAVKTKLLLDSIDAWLLTQPSLVNARKRTLIPVVRERQALADALARYLVQLGLERRARPVPDLTAYLATKTAERGSEPASGTCPPSLPRGAAEPRTPHVTG
jgi:hypothetical protein